MAQQSTLNIRIDNDVKKEFTEICNDLGMNASTAITIFIMAFIRKQGLPFEVTRDIPNAETLAALKEADEIKKNPQAYKSYTDVDKMMEDLLA